MRNCWVYLHIAKKNSNPSIRSWNFLETDKQTNRQCLWILFNGYRCHWGRTSCPPSESYAGTCVESFINHCLQLRKRALSSGADIRDRSHITSYKIWLKMTPPPCQKMSYNATTTPPQYDVRLSPSLSPLDIFYLATSYPSDTWYHPIPIPNPLVLRMGKG